MDYQNLLLNVMSNFIANFLTSLARKISPSIWRYLTARRDNFLGGGLLGFSVGLVVGWWPIASGSLWGVIFSALEGAVPGALLGALIVSLQGEQDRQMYPPASLLTGAPLFGLVVGVVMGILHLIPMSHPFGGIVFGLVEGALIGALVGGLIVLPPASSTSTPAPV